VAQDRETWEGRGDLSKDDLDELKRLRSEVAELRMERDVLIGHVEGPGPVHSAADVW
jgi:hypothetical protein